MANDQGSHGDSEERPYSIYRAGSATKKRGGSSAAPPAAPAGRSGDGDRPYTVYRAAPRSLRARLRGEEETAAGGSGGGRRAKDPGATDRSGWARARRVGKYVLLALLAWLVLSLVLFVISAQNEQGNLPDSAKNALASGSNMLTGTDTVLIIGTDQRPAGSKEPGANTRDAGSRSDTIMLWRIGGGTSRRLSIPRDTVADVPGHGRSKINAAYAFGGPALTIRTIERFTGVPINHIIIVNLAAFPQFIDAIGGVSVTTGRICSDISGGVRNGGFSLYLPPGTHHLDGIQALTLARTRHNRCNPTESDLTRVRRQQQILNGVKGQLLSLHAFFHLPWAAWSAPKVLRTDMGGLTLLSLFGAAEIGGSAPVQVLKPTGATTLPDGESALTVDPGAVHAAIGRLING